MPVGATCRNYITGSISCFTHFRGKIWAPCADILVRWLAQGAVREERNDTDHEVANDIGVDG
jgi:hypothetical protein